jgi:putative ABC transport system permease protein
MPGFAFDLRDVVRALRRDRAYAITAVLTLALTIGATTAVFSIVNGVLLKPLEYRESERLVAIREIWRELTSRYPTFEVNSRHFEHWRANATTFESMAQYVSRSANLTGRGEAAQIVVVSASGSIFDVLGVRAAAGRTLTPADDPERENDATGSKNAGPAVAVITDTLWRQRLGADPRIVGNPIVLDGRPHTVVGILPPDFRLPYRERMTGAVDAFIPLQVNVGWVGDHNNEAIGRLRPGVTLEKARAELDVLQAQVSKIATKQALEPVTLAASLSPLTEHVVGSSRRGLLLLMGAILAVLLIACSNLASLSLTRTIGRLREAAIRSALGASRGRLIGRTLLEQLLLSVAGGSLGIWVAWMALAAFVRTAPVDLPRVNDVALDGRVLAFAAAVSILASVLVAIFPAFRTAGRDVQGALRATTTSVAGDRGGLRRHSMLLAMQVALSVVLLVVTGLLTLSFVRVSTADRGFVAERVLAVDIALPATRYAEEKQRQPVYDRLLAAIHALPGVESATTTSMLPLRGQGQMNFMVPEGASLRASELPSANFRFVGPEFFRTLGVTVRRGRSFRAEERDPGRPAPVLVSEPTAARLWPGQDPIGRRFSRGIPGEQGFEVVGVAANARTTMLDDTQPLMVYIPYWWRSRASTSLLIRTKVDPSTIVGAVRGAVQQIDPEIAVGQSRPLEELVDASLAGRRYQTQLFIAFGLVAIFIATVGVYAVASYVVSRRRREMNIRIALGAQTSHVVGLLLRQGMAPVAAGVAAGAAGALAIGGAVSSLLFEVRARDPLVVAVVVTAVGLVGLATCGIAARRGLSLDPAAALRVE